VFIGMPYVRPAREHHVQGNRYGSITVRCNHCDADADSSEQCQAHSCKCNSQAPIALDMEKHNHETRG